MKISGQNKGYTLNINTYIFAHTHIHTKETCGQAEINNRNRNIQVGVRIDGCTDRRTYEQIDRQSDRQSHRQTGR